MAKLLTTTTTTITSVLRGRVLLGWARSDATRFRGGAVSSLKSVELAYTALPVRVLMS